MTGVHLKNKAVVALVTGTVLAVSLFAAAPASAEPAKKKKNSQVANSPPKLAGAGVEKKDTGAVISGDAVEKKVEKLADKINWETSLDEAKSLAQKQHKPIFWIHLLGDIDGEC